MLANKVYDVLKWIAQIVLPAIASFYYAIARIWNLPYGDEVCGTITAFDALLGVMLGISTLEYNANKKAELEEVRRLNGQN